MWSTRSAAPNLRSTTTDAVPAASCSRAARAARAKLVRNPGVHGIGFTGSPKVGVEIAKTAAERLKPVLLELGGKGACLVLDDADIDKSVKTLALTWVFHSGQICGAPTRAIVHESVRDQLVERLTAFAKTLTIGPANAPGTQVSPVISAAQRDRIEDYIASVVAEGATVAVGGDRPDLSPGFYAAPTLLVDCRPDMKAVREEIFGPVISLITVSSDDEAVTVANNSDYGLVNYVFSEDRARAWAVANQLVCATSASTRSRAEAAESRKCRSAAGSSAATAAREAVTHWRPSRSRWASRSPTEAGAPRDGVAESGVGRGRQGARVRPKPRAHGVDGPGRHRGRSGDTRRLAHRAGDRHQSRVEHAGAELAIRTSLTRMFSAISV